MAKAVGVHPNTVRLYEQEGLIPPVPRSPSGYRQYTPYHLDCMRLARLVMSGPWTGRAIRRSGVQVALTAAQWKPAGAYELARQHLAVVHAEQAQAEAAAHVLERWAGRVPTASDERGSVLRIGDAARRLGTTIDALRNWERNGLVDVPRQPDNGYRLYGPAELDRLRVVRLLLQAGYSMMSVLRILTYLDQDHTADVRQVLDTPRPDEEVLSAADRWLSALADQEKNALAILEMAGEINKTYPPGPQTEFSSPPL
jgi:DNA-binding transcriptional MerR regulator